MGKSVRITDVEVLEGEMKGIKAGKVEVLVANIEGELYAIGDRCTHRGCLLSKGKIEGDVVVCPCHRSRFNLRTGSVISGPAKKSSPVFEVEGEGTDVLIHPTVD